MRAVLLVWLSVSLTATGFPHSSAHAQVSPGQILPPLPAPPPPELEPLPRERVFVREIRVIGSTVFSTEELAEVTAPYVNRELTAEDLEAVRLALTLLYVNKGYVNSGAILPDQTVVEGVIRFQIIEGEVTSIEVQGNRWFRAGYLQKRLLLGAGPPLNVNALQQQIQLLLQDPRIRRLTAEVKPGLKPGEAVLNVLVEERAPYKLWLDVNNYEAPSVGAEQGIVNLEHQNLTGNGDILTLRYGASEGVNPLLDFKYSLPFTARDTTVILQYQHNPTTVIEEPFADLDIEGEEDIYTLTLRQPVYRTLNSEFALELTGERSSQETSLLGVPFTLSPGAQQGKSDVTAVRTAQEWVYRTQNQVLAARSRFSVGVDALGATINPAGEPDGQFFAWLGQFQWVQRLETLDTQLIFRSALQLAADPLLTLEQIAVGGRYSVRGYREDTILGDNAFLASLEVRVPLVRNTGWADFVEVAPFVDYGRAWNTKSPNPDLEDLLSVGVGLRWAVTDPSPNPLRMYFELYWGHPFREIKTLGPDLQDEGFHFQFIFGAY